MFKKSLLCNAMFLLAALTFFSCSDMTSAAPLVPQNELLADGAGRDFQSPSSSPNNFAKTIVFKGTVASSGAVPETTLALFESPDISKSAQPDISDTGKYEYFATATSESGLTENGEFGTTPDTARTFTISLALGEKWTVVCGLRESSTKIAVLKDSCRFEPDVEEPVFTHMFSLVSCKDGSGSLALEVTVPGTVAGALVECSKPAWAAAAPEVSVVGTKLTISASSIASGSYDVYIRLLNSDGVLVYGFYQTINVFDGAETNYWRSSGGTSDAMFSAGEFVIDAAALAAFAQTVFYVGDTGVAGAKGKSDSNDGTAYSPFETVDKATSTIVSLGGVKAYKIFICGTVQENVVLSSDLDGKAGSISIEGFGPLGTDSKPTAVLDANSSGRALKIGTGVPVTLQNLRVTGGLVDSDPMPTAGGAGIYLGDGGDLTLAGDVVVERNHTSLNGGGIFASATASLKIKGAVTVYGNTNGNAASPSASNLYLSSGAKIQVLDALETTAGGQTRKSKIAVSCEDSPASAAPIVFTHGYKSKNPAASPANYFYGDKFGVASDASGEAALFLSGGSASLEDLYDDITISINRNFAFKKCAQKKFTFSSNASEISYSFRVTYCGELVPDDGNWYTVGTDSVTLLSVPSGAYMIGVTALCGGKTYSAEFEVKIADVLVPEGTGGTTLAECMLASDLTDDIEVRFAGDYKTETPEFPEEEIADSKYYMLISSSWEKRYSCVVPAGKTLTLKADAPVTITSGAVYKMFKVYGTLVIGNNISVSGEGLYHNVIDIESGGVLVLDGGTIKNGSGSGGTSLSAVRIEDGGKFMMKGGLMTGNNDNGAVQVAHGGRFEMTGGEISGNNDTRGRAGGVQINSGGEFIKSGGVVKDNTRGGSVPMQMVINANGKYGPSESALTTYDAKTEVADEF